MGRSAQKNTQPDAVASRYRKELRALMRGGKTEKGARRHVARHSKDIAVRDYAQDLSRIACRYHGRLTIITPAHVGGVV